MKRANNNLWLVGAVSLMLPLCLRAQNTVGPVHGKLRVENLQVEKAGDGLEVTMRLNLDSLEMASNRFMELTPVLTDGEHTLTLDPIVIAGRRQYILYQRVREEQYRRSGKNPLVFAEKEPHQPVG